MRETQCVTKALLSFVLRTHTHWMCSHASELNDMRCQSTKQPLPLHPRKANLLQIKKQYSIYEGSPGVCRSPNSMHMAIRIDERNAGQKTCLAKVTSHCRCSGMGSKCV